MNSIRNTSSSGEYSKIGNLLYFLRKGGLLPYTPLLLGGYLALNTPFNYTEAYQKGVAGIIDHEITQRDGTRTVISLRENDELTLQEYIQDGTVIDTTTYQTPDGNWFTNMNSGVTETWRTREFGVKTVNQILENLRDVSEFQRAENFELNTHNLPNEQDINALIQSLESLIKEGGLKGNIEIQGFASAEGDTPEDLISTAGDSYDKNLILANARAKYIQAKLSENATIQPFLGELSAIVNTLTYEDLSNIYTLFDFSSLSDIHNTLKSINRGEMELNNRQKAVIQDIFKRGVSIRYNKIQEQASKNNIDYSFQYTNKPFNEIFAAIIVLVGLIFSLSWLTSSAYAKIQNDYVKNKQSKKGMRSAAFLGATEISKIDKFEAEFGK